MAMSQLENNQKTQKDLAQKFKIGVTQIIAD